MLKKSKILKSKIKYAAAENKILKDDVTITKNTDTILNH